MICYGLDSDLANKVFVKKSKMSDSEIQFNNQYALTGLNNFFESYP